MKRLLFSYLASLAGVGRLRLAAVVGLIVLGSLTEGIGIAVLIAVLQVLGLDLQAQGTLSATATAMLHGMTALGISATLFPLLLLYIATQGVHSALGRVQSVATFNVEQRFILAVRERLYRAIANADWLFHCRSRSTDFTQALTEEANRLGQATFTMVALAADLIVSAVFVAFALSVSVSITLMVLAAGVLQLAVYRGMVRNIHIGGSELSAAMKAFYAATIEQTQSLKIAKAYSAQERTTGLVVAAGRRVWAAYGAITRRQAAVASSFEIGSTLALSAMLYVAAEVIRLPAATMLTLLLLFSRLMPRFLSAHQHLRTFAGAVPAYASISDLTERCEQAGEPSRAPGPAPSLEHGLRFAHVCFSYRRKKEPTLQAIDLVIETGSIVALAGPSGSGKSTIADLAMGLLTPEAGLILVDDMPLTRANARAWREHIGYVGAETSLFHTSLRENLLWAQPDATDADIMEALRLAAAEDFVLSLPGQLDALVGDRGVLLSQGERQRIGLARALLRRPRLLILDEATNGLDAENETRVMQSIKSLPDHMTVLLVAHRLSTLHWADRIYVLENGRVVEAGSWAEMNGAAGERFRALSEAQWLARETPLPEREMQPYALTPPHAI
jgi:ATP-binding cassette subfamily C protein